MTKASTLLDVYIDINALLLFACLLWCVSSLILRAIGHSHAATTRLRLLRWGFVAVIFGPVFALWLTAAPQPGAAVPAHSLNLSDFILSQYLQGRFEMNPTALEQMLGLRSWLTAELLGGTGPLGATMLLLLASGATMFALRLVLSFARLRRILADAHVWRRIGRLELRVSDTVAVPFSTRGIFRRYVVLPSSLLTRDPDRRIAVGHELQHLRQGDVEWEIALALLKPFFFWNPAFHIWRNQVEEMRELSCDQRVMAKGRYDVAAYCQCLLGVCKDSLRRRHLLAVDMPVVALMRTENRLLASRSIGLLRRRMTSLVEGKVERHSKPLSCLLLIPVVALTLTASVAIQSPADWSQDRIMLSTIINLEHLAEINGSQPTFGSPGW